MRRLKKNMPTINERIKQVAIRWKGVREIGDNESFDNAAFQDIMEACGWETSQAWCAYFAELCWKQAYQECDNSYIPLLDLLFSSGALATYYNFKRSKDFIVDNVPEVGSIGVMQRYRKNKGTWQGHAFIVIDVRDGCFKTIEGNSNSQGSRNGQEVATKVRPLDFDIKKNGLVLKGFIHPVKKACVQIQYESIDAIGHAHDDLGINTLK